ncbi:MAG: 4-alpha-glucanotransferase [Burkholderiaceae bacterium]
MPQTDPDRRAGILLHPTSLPGAYGNGDLGDEAFAFVDWLHSAGMRAWQMLPLSPPGPANSPYMSMSLMAGNPMLINLERLAGCGWLDEADLARVRAAAAPDPHRADLDAAARARLRALRQAFARFFDRQLPAQRRALADYRIAQADWLDDYALFMALGEERPGAWTDWPHELAHRHPAALAGARRRLTGAIDFWCFVQWVFDGQWQALRAHATARDIQLIGDLPIYPAHCAEVWSAPHLFELDAAGRPDVVAGVPPDYFSETGQLWGNPLYRWPAHAGDGFAWWRRRIARSMSHCDLLRLDHFRGFAGYWEVPAQATDARAGRWRPGPGDALFTALRAVDAPMPLIAEDLGDITDDVLALRRAFGLPGMAILQFAFGDTAANPYLPHNLDRQTVIYTGTHDNDTSQGWFATADPAVRERVQIYFKCDGSDIHWELIHAASASVARLAVYPLQDVLGLDTRHRMNTPGLAQAQWAWRFTPDQVQAWHGERLYRISAAHGRLPGAPAVGRPASLSE